MSRKSKQIVVKVAASAFLDGAELPLSSFAVNYGVNGLPTAQIRPALGDKAFGARLKFNPSEAYSGKSLVIKMKYGSREYLMFSGYVSGVSAARMEHENRSAGLLTLNAVHTGAALAGLPTRDRFTLSSGANISGSYDTYRDRGPETQARLWSEDSGLGDVMSLPKDMGKFIARVVRALYNSEKSYQDKTIGAASQAFRTIDSKALAELDKVATPCDMSFPADMDSLIVGVKKELVNALTRAWMSSNGLILMSRSISEKYGLVSPVCDRLALLPDFTSHSGYTRTITPAEIFGVQRSTGVDPVKIGGVVLAVNVENSDKQLQAVGSSVVFYPDVPDGQLVYMNPPSWTIVSGARLMMSRIPPPETRTRGSPVSASGTLMRALEDKNTYPGVIKWYQAIARAEFGMRTWSRDQLTLSVAFMPDIWIGQPVMADIKDSKISFQSRLVGVVSNVSVGMAHGSFDMSVTLSGVRSIKDNDEKAFTELPVYPKAKPSSVNLKLFSIA